MGVHISRQGTRLLALAAALAAGATLPAATPSFGFPSFRDIMLTVHARRALNDDPLLAEVNLTVQVRGGVATLVGPVPNEQVGKRAARHVERVPGIQEVRNETHVAAPPKGEDALLAPYTGPPPLTAPAPVASTPNPTPVAAGEASPGFQATVSLLAPVVVSESKPIVTTATTASATVAARAVEQLRRSDPRFRSIGVELRGTTAIIHGADAVGEHVMALAQAVSHLPGVERVQVQNQSAAPR